MSKGIEGQVLGLVAASLSAVGHECTFWRKNCF